ncbi:MAG: hypothetical protein GY737_14040 [Desulfobacteraceae bacterium]|nr:hypothetical protein [Desulfobacteraceae bacterium]
MLTVIYQLLNHGGLAMSAMEILRSDSTGPIAAAWPAWIAGLFVGEMVIEVIKKG